MLAQLLLGVDHSMAVFTARQGRLMMLHQDVEAECRLGLGGLAAERAGEGGSGAVGEPVGLK
mgnify:CR=1 FL=1